jgi:hypothetical protein
MNSTKSHRIEARLSILWECFSKEQNLARMSARNTKNQNIDISENWTPWIMGICRKPESRRIFYPVLGTERRGSGADGGAEGVGEGLAEAVDVGFVFSFDHDAGELLGAGIAKDDASIIAKRG